MTVVTLSDSSNSLASLEISSLAKISFEPSRNILSPFSLTSPPYRFLRNCVIVGNEYLASYAKSAGAKSIKDLPKCTTFVKVNRQLNTVFN